MALGGRKVQRSGLQKDLVGAWLAARDELFLRLSGASESYFVFVAASLERGVRFRRLAS